MTYYFVIINCSYKIIIIFFLSIINNIYKLEVHKRYYPYTKKLSTSLSYMCDLVTITCTKL